jgi:hypothetical protein
MIQHLRNKQENITRGPVRKQIGEKDWDNDYSKGRLVTMTTDSVGLLFSHSGKYVKKIFFSLQLS